MLSHCPGCGFMVQRDWDTCKFCTHDLDATRGLIAARDIPPPPPPPRPPPFAGAPPMPGAMSGQSAATVWGPVLPPSGMPPPPSAPAASAARRFVLLFTVLCLVIGAAAVYAVATNDSGPGHPGEWDPRVAGIVSFVEEQRGGPFDHPVYVDFLTPAEYSAQTKTDASTLSDENKAELDRQEGFFRSLGLVQGDIDLFAATNQVSDSGTVAFYSPTDKRVHVRGTDITVGLKVTLVHELTHAWQDQHFDLTQMQDAAQTSGESSALTTLIEGDAVRIENLYIDALSDADRAAYEKGLSADQAGAVSDLADVPDVLLALFGAPYDLGPPFLQVLEAKGSTSSIDAAFKGPPRSEEQVLDPLTFLAHDEPLSLSLPKLPTGEKPTDSGDFGVIGWFLMLAERTDPNVALDAVEGWGGDSYVTYDKDGTVCGLVDFQGDTATDTEQMKTALDAWAAAMPAGTATIASKGKVVEVATCDPGADSSLKVTGNGSKALALPVYRSYVEAGALYRGLTEDQARCTADAFIKDYTVAQLNDPAGPPDFQQKLDASYAACPA